MSIGGHGAPCVVVFPARERKQGDEREREKGKAREKRHGRRVRGAGLMHRAEAPARSRWLDREEGIRGWPGGACSGEPCAEAAALAALVGSLVAWEIKQKGIGEDPEVGGLRVAAARRNDGTSLLDFRVAPIFI